MQKVLKTASKYAENGDLFTRIQVKLMERFGDTIMLDLDLQDPAATAGSTGG